MIILDLLVILSAILFTLLCPAPAPHCRYMAPEVFRHEQYNCKVDVYAFSMICFQLFEGVPPYWMLDPVLAARKASTTGLRPTWGILNRFKVRVPEKLKQLVESCWAADFDERPEFDHIVEVGGWVGWGGWGRCQVARHRGGGWLGWVGWVG